MLNLTRRDLFRVATELTKYTIVNQVLHSEHQDTDTSPFIEVLKSIPVNIDYVDAYSFRGSCPLSKDLRESVVTINPDLLATVNLERATLNFLFETNNPDMTGTRDFTSLMLRDLSSQMIVINTESGQSYIVYKPNSNDSFYALGHDVFPNILDNQAKCIPLKGGVIQIKSDDFFEYGFFDFKNRFTDTDTFTHISTVNRIRYKHGGEADRNSGAWSTLPVVSSNLYFYVVQFDDKLHREIVFYNKGQSVHTSNIDLNINPRNLPLVITTPFELGYFEKGQKDIAFGKEMLHFVMRGNEATNYLSLNIEERQLTKMIHDCGYDLIPKSDISHIQEYFLSLNPNVTPIAILFLDKKDLSLKTPLPWIYIGRNSDGSIFLHSNEDTKLVIEAETNKQHPFKLNAPQVIEEIS